MSEITCVTTRTEVERLMQLRDLQRLINPPVVIRQVCRYCGDALDIHDLTALVVKRNGDAYAHRRCVDREYPR